MICKLKSRGTDRLGNWSLTFGIASLQQLIGPVARMNAVVIDQTRLTRGLLGHSEGALQEAGGAVGAVWSNAECPVAALRSERHLIVLPGSAFNGPIVVAMVVHITLAIEEQSVLALLQGQRT